jgi:hypothetical protein
MPNGVAGTIEEVEASIAEIVKGVEISYLQPLGELDFTQLAPLEIGV